MRHYGALELLLYFMPILAFASIAALLKAIEHIVRHRPYGKELFWAGLLFAVMMWSISASAASHS